MSIFPKRAKCPVCDNEPAIVDRIYGVLPGKKCKQRRDGGRFRRFNLETEESRYRKLQVPWWKIAGLKPTKKDLAVEKYIKYKGYDYYDLRRERDAILGAHHYKDVNTIKAIQEGRIPQGRPVKYSKLPR